MNQKHYWIKNGLLNIIQNVTGVTFGLINFYILVRILSKENFGLWAIFVAFTGIVEFAKNGLTQEASIKYLSSANQEDRKKIITATFIINFGLSVVTLFLILTFGPFLGKLWHSEELVTMLHLYVIIIFLSGLLNQFNCIEQAKLKFRGVAFATISRQFFFFVFIVTCYVTKYQITLINLTLAQIGVAAIATFISYIFTRENIQYTKEISLYWIKKILNFGKYSFGVSLSSSLGGSIDQMMLGAMLSKSASGSFNVAVRVTNMADIPINSVANIVYPQSAIRSELEGPGALKYLYEKSIGVILAILTPAILFVYILSEYLIVYLAGDKYIDSIPLLHITLLTCFFSPYSRQSGTILASSGKTKINFYIVILSTVVLIVLNLILITKFGVMGAAYASLACSIIMFIFTQSLLKKIFNINPIAPWKYAISFYPEFYHKYLKKSK